MANYLQKFGLVLYKSDNVMFHACAWHRLFHLYREQRKSVSEHELQKYVDLLLNISPISDDDAVEPYHQIAIFAVLCAELRK